MYNKRKLPIGVQSFEKLREEGFIYVDKTKYIYKLVHDSVQFFLSRPRRFGKSLLLSTLCAYWEGKKELFSGLDIEKLEADNADSWQPHPVLYFDFNGENYKETPVERVLENHLICWEKKFDITNESVTLGGRFKNLLSKVSEKTGQRCVILIDEYDKPLLELVDEPELQEHNKAVFKGFFSNLKSCDAYICFVFITGVTKFHKVSIFSDLNQLSDISLNKEYTGLCGITEDELRTCFSEEIDTMALEQEISYDECLAELKKMYDGYRFSEKGQAVYNPFSLLSAFYAKAFRSFWFETGTPTFLVNMMRKKSFDVRKFSDNSIYADESSLLDYTGDSLTFIPLLYQTGYLTIEEYNKRLKRYILCLPNEEVRYGLLNSIMPSYVPDARAENGLDIFTLEEYISSGNLDRIKDFLTALFARIPYTTNDAPFEHYFQSVIYLVFTLLGQYTICEMHTFNGRIDCKVETDNFIYLFEFKRDENAEKALAQIDDKNYALSFAADRRKLYKIGVSFDSEKRILAGWKVE